MRIQKIIAIIACIGIVGGGAWYFFVNRANIDKNLFAPQVSITRITLNGVPTANASITLPYTKDTDKYTFINIAADLNGDGKIAAYNVEIPTPTTKKPIMQQEWIVQNFGLRARSDSANAFAFALPDKSITAQKPIALTVVATASALTNWNGTTNALATPNTTQQFTLSTIATDEMSAFYSPDPTGLRDGGIGPGTDYLDTSTAPLAPPLSTVQLDALVAQGEDAPYFTGPNAPARNEPARDNPNAPKPPFGEFHKGMPDYAQGRNQCVPTAVMNSILWLAKKYGYTDRIPMDPVKVVDELKQDFKWTANGVDVFKNFYAGKEAFFKRHNVPVETHGVGRPFDTDIVRKIAREIADGQDVELTIEFDKIDPDNTYRRVGGHMVTVVGAWSAGDNQFLGFHDPGGQGAGGIMEVNEVKGARIVNYRYAGDTIPFIKYVFAESPIPAEEIARRAAEPKPPARPPADVKQIDVLRIGAIYYPTSQFYIGTGPDCDAPHWHATGGAARGIDLTGFIDPKEQDDYFVEQRDAKLASWQDPEACGLGKVAVVPRLTLSMSPAELKKIGVKK